MCMALTHPDRPQLVMTVGLLAVVVYLYTVVAFNFFRKFYNKSEDEDEPDMKCDDMMTVSALLPVLRFLIAPPAVSPSLSQGIPSTERSGRLFYEHCTAHQP